MGRCGGRGREHRKYTLNSSIPSKCQSFHGSRAYSIYSFAQLSWHSTGASELWMVNRGFLLFSYDPVQLSTQKTFNSELWTVRLWTSTDPILFSLNGPFSDSCKNELWTVDLGFLLLSWSEPFTAFLQLSEKGPFKENRIGKAWSPQSYHAKVQLSRFPSE